MHPIQQSILGLFDHASAIPFNLRWIGRQIHVDHPQKVKHHLLQLEKSGLVTIGGDKGEVTLVHEGVQSNEDLVALPVMGYANCGRALSFAEDHVQGFLKVSKRLLNGLNLDRLFVLRAAGDSMNRSNIQGESIEDGDFVIVKKTEGELENGERIVSVIDGCANIKRFYKKGEEVALVSESTKDYLPIFIHENDSYHVVGTVAKVVKNPSF